MEMYGFKGFESDLTCRGFQYEIGKTYKHDGEIEPCNSGFHFCKTLEDVLEYYDFSDGNRFCKIKAVGKIIDDAHKCVTDKIEILEEIEITPELLNELAQSEKYWVREAVVVNPNTNFETLKKLSKDKHWLVRVDVAENQNIDLETLKLLAEDEDDDVRWAIAENTNTDSETLKKLAKDEDWSVRAAVAVNQNTDHETLKLLAEDEDWGIRLAVAENPNVDVKTLKELAEDEESIVREAAVRRLKKN